MLRKIILWILVFSCMGTIFYFSSQEATDSDKTSSAFIKSIVRIMDFSSSLSENEIEELSEKLTFVVRKGAHFSIYAFLGVLLALLFSQYNFCGKRQLFYSVGTAFLYACSDEFHQCFVKGRSGEVRDVFLDSSGALCGVIFIMIITAFLKKLCDKNKYRKGEW